MKKAIIKIENSLEDTSYFYYTVVDAKTRKQVLNGRMKRMSFDTNQKRLERVEKEITKVLNSIGYEIKK